MRAQRVIFRLKDGRRKYATHNGSMLYWEEYDLESLANNVEMYGLPVFTADFQRYDFDKESLRERFPNARIVRVVGYDVEDASLPLDPDVIF